MSGITIGTLDLSQDIFAAVVRAGERRLTRRVTVMIGQGVQEHHGAPAFTLFPDDGSEPEIYIDADIPYVAVAELLCHELAHCILPDHAHDETWRAMDREIWTEAENEARAAQDAYFATQVPDGDPD